MTPTTTSAFDLPDHLAAKADPTLVAADDAHFADLARTLETTVAELSRRLDVVRRAPAGHGQAALERDQEVHRLTARLRTLRRFGLDLCLGHLQFENDSHPVYIGRLGLTDPDGRRLLLDWRSPAAEPFFAATHANPMGLRSRRRYRWTRGRVSDYWDEVFSAADLEGRAALDDESAFIASLGASRSPRMRDVLATIQADQDAIIRAGSRRPLVVDGGPGTGKTVVALHRTAYLLYADPRLGHRRGGVLFVGPHEPYLAYVSDVLPSLGEEGVQTCTLRDLVPVGRTDGTDGTAGTDDAVGPEVDPEVARLKASMDLVRAVDPAVALYEEPPRDGTEVVTPWADVWLSPADWTEAFTAGRALPHNEARDDVWDALVTIVTERHDLEGRIDDDGADVELDATPEMVRRSLEQNAELRAALDRSWPLLEAEDVLGDLWTVPAYLRRCAPTLEVEQVRRLQRADPRAWTVSDLPLLDAMRMRLGDAESGRRRRRREARTAAERRERERVVEHLIAADDSEMHVMSMLRGDDLRGALDGDASDSPADPDLLAGPFAHVVVDEAQELTDAEWHMLLRRCPSRSLTVVGDRAQARHGFTEAWPERLARVGLDRVDVASLTVNYRTPVEIMAEAEPVIRAALPDANVPTSVRESGIPVRHGSRDELDAVLDTWLADHAEGTACVIGDPTFEERDRVRSLSPLLSKGLEFDLVVLVGPSGEPAAAGDAGGAAEGAADGAAVEAAVDRYVAMTRATAQLVLLTSG